jgi:hypothetical protein
VQPAWQRSPRSAASSPLTRRTGFVDSIAGESKHILLAGHFPHLPRLLGRLTSGNSEADPVDFPLKGSLLSKRIRLDKWLERVETSDPNPRDW